MRVEEPPEPLLEICEILKQQFNYSKDSVNSIVVNYYYDGDNTYIPAHRDSTTCLEEGSQVICLSLGIKQSNIKNYNYYFLCLNKIEI